MRVGGQPHAPAALPPCNDPRTHGTGGWVGSGPVWTGAENLISTGIRSPDRRRKSSEKTLFQCHFFATSPTWTGLALHRGLRSEMTELTAWAVARSSDNIELWDRVGCSLTSILCKRNSPWTGFASSETAIVAAYAIIIYSLVMYFSFLFNGRF